MKTLLSVKPGVLSPSTQESAYADVLAYQNPQVVDRIAKEHNLSLGEAEKIFLATKQFLYICGTRNGTWGPTFEIDKGWHEFLMYTRQYQKFCQRFFGRFIHHRPNVNGEPIDHMRPKRTLLAAIEVFGKENLSDCWEYSNPQGTIRLGPNTPNLEKWEPLISSAQQGGPCDSCGCSPCDGDGD
jgi:hypothetical protein